MVIPLILIGAGVGVFMYRKKKRTGESSKDKDESKLINPFIESALTNQSVKENEKAELIINI